MLIKRAYAESSLEDPRVEILRVGTGIKTASISDPVQRFISSLRSDPRYTYVLVNAMGYSEFYGPNSNKDWYGLNPEIDFNGLLHSWVGYGEDVVADKMKAKTWPHGYPCFYDAAAYAHHKNTDPAQLGFGDVVFVYANPHMKRVELVIRVFNDEAEKKGHGSIVSRIENGERVDVSMGAKIPFDLCLHPTTLVQTIDGWRQAGEIEVGAQVFTHRGRYRPITERFSRETNEDLVCIRAAGVPSLRVTGSHPMFIVREAALRACKGSVDGKRRRCSPDGAGRCSFCEQQLELRPEWIDAADVRLGDYLAAPAGEVGRTNVELPKARLLGYWIGDGHRIRQRTGKKKDGDHRLMGFGFTVAHRDTSHCERLLRTIVEAGSKNEPNVYEADAGREAFQIHTYDQELAAWLISQGADENYCKRLAEEVFSWNRTALLELIGGWVDTDGHFDKDKGLVRIATSRRELALDGQRILRALGVPSGITAATGECGEVYQFSIQPDHVERLELWRYAEKVRRLEKERKGGSSIVITGGYALHPVRAVELTPHEGVVVNFSVAEDESYVAEGIITHNCSICSDWSRIRAAMKHFDVAKHRHVMQPVLEEHKRKAITGLAQTRAEYCECMRLRGGKILPDGRRVFVYNDAPRFFDISFVWVGADRTARVMWHLGGGERRRQTSPSVGPILEALNALIGQKHAAMEKEIPGGIASAALADAHTAPSLEVVIVTARQRAPAKSILASLGALGIVASPREFSAAVTGTPRDFSPDAPGIDTSCCVDPTDFDSVLATALAPMATTRSSFASMLGPRLRETKETSRGEKPATDDDLSRRYAGYRLGLLKHASALFQRAASTLDQEKIAQGDTGLLLGQGGMVQWISSHLAHDLGSDDVDAANKLAAMLVTPADLSKLATALDATMRIEKTSSLRTAVRGVANTMKDL